MYIEEIADIVNQEINALCADAQIVIWGAGKNADILVKYTNLCNFRNWHIVDKGKAGISFFGKIIQSPDDIDWKIVEAVIITPFYSAEEIGENLKVTYKYKGRIINIRDISEQPVYEYPSASDLLPNEKVRVVLKENIKFKDIHKGERVFILCTGPSIAQMDLKKLANERVIAVSEFFLHKDCKLINPDYYCNAQFEPEMVKASDIELELLKKIENNFPKAEFFFHVSQKNVIDQMPEYNCRKVNYIDNISIPTYGNGEVDLTKLILQPQSIPIMALQIAIYMGFKEIYLIGTEHDILTTKKYHHFYEDKESIEGKVCKNKENGDTLVYHYQLSCLSNLWNQYKMIKKIADRNHIKIYNATIGGVLDIFERVNYDDIL